MDKDIKNLTVGSIIEVTAKEPFNDDSPISHYVGYYYGPVSESNHDKCLLMFSDPLDPNPARGSSAIMFYLKDIVNVYKIREANENNTEFTGPLMMVNETVDTEYEVKE